MRTVRNGVGLLAAVLALPACATTTRSAIGLAASAPGEPAAVPGAASVRLNLDEGLRAEVRATSAVATSPGLGLSLTFDTKVLGYSFDAASLVVRDGHGGEWRPTSASAGWSRYGSCEAAPAAADPLGGWVPLASGTCVQVAFDRTVTGSERVELEIAGVAIGQRRLAPATVTLARTERKSRKADPALVEVLTLPLKILLFPLAMYGGG
jgi:hypothetical protein